MRQVANFGTLLLLSVVYLSEVHEWDKKFGGFILFGIKASRTLKGITPDD